MRCWWDHSYYYFGKGFAANGQQFYKISCERCDFVRVIDFIDFQSHFRRLYEKSLDRSIEWVRPV